MTWIRNAHFVKVGLVAMARAGDATAQNIMGAAYNDGHGVEKNTSTSIEWFSKSAAQGNAKAQYNLGGLYLLEEESRAPDYQNAIEYLKMAMAQDYASAFMLRGQDDPAWL